MRDEQTDSASRLVTGEMEDRSWYPVYAAVIVFTVLVISALAAFSNYFAS